MKTSDNAFLYKRMEFAGSLGDLANLVIGVFGCVPMCHRAGGLAAHYMRIRGHEYMSPNSHASEP